MFPDCDVCWEGNLISKFIASRQRWDSSADFVLSCVGYAIGLGNVWRFPYLCYKHGGGAFLIPYIITVVFCGVPLFILETSWGQLLKGGGLSIWKICPIFKGVGIASLIMNFWLNSYYIVVVAWALYYLVWAVGGEIPWRSCQSKSCKHFEDAPSLKMIGSCNNAAQGTENDSVNNASLQLDVIRKPCLSAMTNFTHPAEKFWAQTLRISEGIDQPGKLQWDLAICLGLSWLICYFCIFRGVKWTAKIVYFTALFPYVMLAVLLVRSATLPGALDGIRFFITPNLTSLYDSTLWIDAVTQVFYSYGLGLGVLWALGSYNAYQNNVYRQAIIVCGVNTATSFLTGLVVFATIGYMSATSQSKQISDVVVFGPGLLFIVYPSAVLRISAGPTWTILFFLMVIFLGLDSQFCQLEGFITALVDQWPTMLRQKYRREFLLLFIAVLSFLVGLSCVTEGGIYVFGLFDYYAASGWCLLWLLFFECIAISWSFGIDRWYEELKLMIGHYPCSWLKFCWVFATPAMCAGVFVFSLTKYARLRFLNYEYPIWADALGWLIGLSSMVWIPIYAIYCWCSTSGTLLEKLKLLFRPDVNLEDIRQKVARLSENTEAGIASGHPEPVAEKDTRSTGQIQIGAEPKLIQPIRTRGCSKAQVLVRLTDHGDNNDDCDDVNSSVIGGNSEAPPTVPPDSSSLSQEEGPQSYCVRGCFMGRRGTLTHLMAPLKEEIEP